MSQTINDDDLKRRTSMTKESIINSCKKNKLYLTPHLNDVLYLHYHGYQKIENLEEYSGLKCLWLECNAISQISGLDQQSNLRCLYLHNNFIRKIENLQNCTQLDTLNLSHNYIKTVEGCNSMVLPVLNTLDLSHNSLSSIDGLADLVECKTLSVLDLSHNRIEDILIVKILSKMPQLHVLTLTGNPVVSEIPSYRKTLTVECKNLTYLDSRPIFDKDRACAEAWKRGGYEEEKREHIKWTAAQQRKITDSVRATLRLRKKLAENRSPNSTAAIELKDEKALINSELIESSDEPSKDIVSTKSDEIDDCIVDPANSVQLNGSTTELEIHNADSKEILSTLSKQNENLGPLNDISGQCLNTATLLSIEKNSTTFGGTLDLTSNEFIDINTQNIFNICLNDENRNASKSNTNEKTTIQVLSESNFSDLLETTDFEASNEFGLNENDCIDSIETVQSIAECLIDETTDKQTIETNFVEKIEGKSQSMLKSSSTITFYCENLDNLKEIDSDSDVDFDEI